MSRENNICVNIVAYIYVYLQRLWFFSEEKDCKFKTTLNAKIRMLISACSLQFTGWKSPDRENIM